MPGTAFNKQQQNEIKRLSSRSVVTRGNQDVIDATGFFQPITAADTDAPNNAVYYSSTQSKLVYKDSGGVVNDLY